MRANNLCVVIVVYSCVYRQGHYCKRRGVATLPLKGGIRCSVY